MKRTFGGIQFTRMADGYSRPGDGLGYWVSESGIKLFCSNIRWALTSHWELTAHDGKRYAGMSAKDALMNARILERK